MWRVFSKEYQYGTYGAQTKKQFSASRLSGIVWLVVWDRNKNVPARHSIYSSQNTWPALPKTLRQNRPRTGCKNENLTEPTASRLRSEKSATNRSYERRTRQNPTANRFQFWSRLKVMCNADHVKSLEKKHANARVKHLHTITIKQQLRGHEQLKKPKKNVGD